MSEKASSPVMLYDGKCLFCNGAVAFVLRFEFSPILKFAPLQSKAGMTLMKNSGLEFDVKDVNKLGSFVVVDQNGKAYTKFRASMAMMKFRGGIWRIFALITETVVPVFIGDFVYSFVWWRRGLILGTVEKCVRPSEKLKSRLLYEGDDFLD